MNSGQILNDAIDELGTRLPGYTSNPSNPSLDLSHGGLNGILPNLAVVKDGVVYGSYISNTPQTTGMVHAFLLDYPKVFDMLSSDNSLKMRAKLSRWISHHVETIDGINDQINWDFDDSMKVGRTGESIHDVTNATLVPTEPTLGWTEKLGYDIRNMLTFIGRYGVMDPYTGGTLAPLLPGFERVAWTLDMKSFSIMVAELDATNSVVVNAQIVANMMARTNGELVLKKDPNSAKEVKKYSIPFTGFGIRGLEVVAVAQNYIDAMNKNHRDALLTKSVYQSQVDEVSSNVIPGTLLDQQNM